MKLCNGLSSSNHQGTRNRVITELINCSNRLCRPYNRVRENMFNALVSAVRTKPEQVSARYHMMKAAE